MRSPLYDLGCTINTFPWVPHTLSRGSTTSHYSTKISLKSLEIIRQDQSPSPGTPVEAASGLTTASHIRYI